MLGVKMCMWKYAKDIFHVNVANHTCRMRASTADARKQIHYVTNVVCKLGYIGGYFVTLTSIHCAAGLELWNEEHIAMHVYLVHRPTWNSCGRILLIKFSIWWPLALTYQSFGYVLEIDEKPLHMKLRCSARKKTVIQCPGIRVGRPGSLSIFKNDSNFFVDMSGQK